MSINPPFLIDSSCAWIAGIDLAWGNKNADGLCLIHASRGEAKLISTFLTRGDVELIAWLKQNIPESEHALLAIDAPLVVPNASGSRPIDKRITLDFGKYHAGCYPANSTLCARPPRVAKLLQDIGYVIGHDLRTASRLAAEVYPHAAIIRLFKLERIIKYKKGLIAAKRPEFQRFQNLLRTSLKHYEIEISTKIDTLLNTPWSKSVEDQTDAIVCALIGYHHWLYRGKKSEPLGDVATGFILLPVEARDLVA